FAEHPFTIERYTTGLLYLQNEIDDTASGVGRHMPTTCFGIQPVVARRPWRASEKPTPAGICYSAERSVS
ncbi:MAG: hypothetical protein PVF80_16355, partial [Gammaproteobacteria bacterium]